MKSGRDIHISQCMIVKNEEKNIERALLWGQSIMWEQIVVDTGSTDRTVEIARSMGAKVCHFSWIDDFAAAKNYAIEQAQGDWIALLDADEYIDGNETEKLKQLLEMADRKGMDGLTTGWQQLDDEGRIFSSGTQIRFFRNCPDIRYRRRIHEQLESAEGRELYVGDVVEELSIFHTGYQSRAMAEKKGNQRNLRLIRKELEDHPDDYEMMGYMGDEYFSEGNMAEAKKWYGRAVEQMPKQIPEYDQRSAVTFTRLLSILLQEKGALWQNGEAVYDTGRERFPKEADFDYIAGCFWAEQGQALKALRHLEAALEKLEKYGCSNRALLMAGNLTAAYDLLVRCCYEAGEQSKCVSYGTLYLKYDRFSMSVLSRLLKVLTSGRGQKEEREVLDFLSRLYDFSVLKDRIFIVTTAQRAGCQDFARFAADNFFTSQEREKLGL